VSVLDANGCGVGAGVPGEIVVKGRSFSAGYWHNPTLTASKFIADPSSPDGQLFLTGDIGKKLPDGSCFISVVTIRS
jgi:non-ribosomal peptide synthetase component F